MRGKENITETDNDTMTQTMQKNEADTMLTYRVVEYSDRGECDPGSRSRQGLPMAPQPIDGDDTHARAYNPIPSGRAGKPNSKSRSSSRSS